MAYSVAADIQAEFKNIDFAATGALVTTAKISDWILEADALINSYVGMNYVVPVTTGDGLSLLKMFSRILVSDRVHGVLEVKQLQNTRPNQLPNKPNLTSRDIIKELEKIKSGEIALIGATPTVASSGFSSFNVLNGIEPVMKKDTVQW